MVVLCGLSSVEFRFFVHVVCGCLLVFVHRCFVVVVVGIIVVGIVVVGSVVVLLPLLLVAL